MAIWQRRQSARTLLALFAACCCLSVYPAAAQQRIEAAQQSCSALQGLVQRSGRVLLYTGPYLYDTYAVSCVGRQSEIPAYLRTRDNPQCLVGYTCGPSAN